MVPPCKTIEYLLNLSEVLVALVVKIDVQSIFETVHEVQIRALVLEIEQLQEVSEVACSTTLAGTLTK